MYNSRIRVFILLCFPFIIIYLYTYCFRKRPRERDREGEKSDYCVHTPHIHTRVENLLGKYFYVDTSIMACTFVTHGGHITINTKSNGANDVFSPTIVYPHLFTRTSDVFNRAEKYLHGLLWSEKKLLVVSVSNIYGKSIIAATIVLVCMCVCGCHFLV